MPELDAIARDFDDQDRRAPLFEVAADLIRHNITVGLLYPGLVVQESALSERIGMSRATVKRALEMLEEERRIEKFAGRGFVVSGGKGEPRRDDLRLVELDLAALDEGASKPNWLRIYDDVARHVTRCPVFGTFRIIEALMADEYGVSRTIIRDVLGRLQERGLIQKNRTSRWVVEPLTSQRIKDKFELRTILELAAMRSARPATTDLQSLRDDIHTYAQGTDQAANDWFNLDRRFFDLLMMTTPNADLASAAASNRLALEAAQAALFSLGLPADRQSIMELGQVVDLYLAGALEAACNMLSTHLEKARDRTVAQLKITAIIAPPQDLPSYLQTA